MFTEPITIREATVEDIPFLQTMIWEALLASYVTLFVDPTNTPAIALYQHVGFVEVGEQDKLLEMPINLH
jgi:ribosomal protein S18 acetylase RimI-like enzyme